MNLARVLLVSILCSPIVVTVSAVATVATYF